MASRRIRWPGRCRSVLAGVLVVCGAVGVLVGLERATGPERAAIRTYTRLLVAAEAGDLDAARALCTRRFLAGTPLALADEGGLIGLPRSIHKNFRAWRQGGAVWFCPANRVGPVYRFVFEDGSWKFDGLVGLLRPGGALVPITPEPPRPEGVRAAQPDRPQATTSSPRIRRARRARSAGSMSSGTDWPVVR